MARVDQQLTPPSALARLVLEARIPLARSAASPAPGMRHRLVFAALAGVLLTGCAQPAPPPPGAPLMTLNAVYTADGADLPLRSFLPAGEPRAALVALHGFNDYSNAFSEAGLYFMAHGIALYAYDQRGFGDAPARGRWVGQRLLADDVRLVVALVRRRHPGVPVFLLGESMGAALAMVAMAEPDPPAADGVILVAPAVRGRTTLTPLQRAVLDVVSSAFPWFTVTGQGLGITPSDNYTMLRQLAHDPLIIHHTRTDTLRGLVDLMDAASDAAPRLTAPLLMLTGEQDEIITPIPTCLMLSRLPPRPPGAWRLMMYPQGYHMLLRDRDADLVMADIVQWIADRRAPLPSGDERLTGTPATMAADIARLPTCGTVADRLREHPEFAALAPAR
jgi:alpha-beta hydrolase superfamily lysophospholipase